MCTTTRPFTKTYRVVMGPASLYCLYIYHRNKRGAGPYNKKNKLDYESIIIRLQDNTLRGLYKLTTPDRLTGNPFHDIIP